MSELTDLIDAAKTADPGEKAQYLQHLMQKLKKTPKDRLAPKDRQALLSYALDELDALLTEISATTNCRTKDILLTCENHILHLVMYLCPDASGLPAGTAEKIKSQNALAQAARTMAITLNDLFEEDPIDTDGAEKLLSTVDKIHEEYRRGQVWAGLLYYEYRFYKLTSGAKAAFASFLKKEFDRYLSMSEHSQDILMNLELMAELCVYIPCRDTHRQLLGLLALGNKNLAYCAATSILALKLDLPQNAVETLARDLCYAATTHALLDKHGMAHRFPAECATEEYLAKSSLVHALLYPTELGQAPDEIEYIGKATWLFKKNVFHIFRFRSESATLSDKLRGKWLIGWSCPGGIAISHFDLYDDYAKATPEATVKHIKKKLIG